jgi:hypothetical protein
MRKLFSFPNPVNETSARLVAAGAIVQSVAILVFREGWILVPLVYGFLARVLTGPTLSPLGQFVTRLVSPFVTRRLGFEDRFLPGPPKRFAQGIGLTFTGGAALAWRLGAPVVSYVLLGGLIGAASLEAFLGICLGCMVHNRIWGCDDCNDLSARVRATVGRVPATN